jgi:PAS domain S-box-containing protein
MLAIDSAGRLVIFNQACEQLTGYSAQEVLGTNQWTELLLPTDRNDARAFFNNQMLDPLLPEQAVIIRTRSGAEWYVSWAVKPLQGEDGVTTHVIATGIPIAKRPQTTAEQPYPTRLPTEHYTDERLALAREIHDGPLHDFYQLNMQLTKLTAADTAHDRAALAAAQHSARTAIAALRQICTDWRPPTLAIFGLSAAIQAHTRELRQAYPHLQIQLALQDDGVVIDEQTRLQLYRIYQTAISNVVRHAQARAVAIQFSWDAEQICLSITDDGQGFQPPSEWHTWAHAGQHYGLLGMHERARICGGLCQIRSRPGEGTTVQVSLPGVVVAEQRMAS